MNELEWGVQFEMITPIFRIFYIEKAYSFYIDFLGFTFYSRSKWRWKRISMLVHPYIP